MTHWKDQEHLLDRMDMAALNRAYVTYPGVWGYFLLTVAAVAAALTIGGIGVFQVLLSVGAVVLLYPLFWYVLHRFVLHSRFLWKSEFTGKVWKRIHYDHHRQPNNLAVLFGSLTHTIPTVVILTGSVGFAIGGVAGLLWASAAGFVMTMVYEYVHCIQHLGYLPDSNYLRRMKRLHLLHHFHNEKGNYGIIEFWPDRLFGTFYREVGAKWPKSPDVRSLGYHGEVARRYPHVDRLTVGEGKKPSGEARAVQEPA
ncbi:sterol desaturase family protein [Parvularcula sp. BGMRC 0090]|uniref:Sterol desaturase family protein n=1 Tax=Parvularcula maris TaxID=2965077 RepID=A0A9X2RIQ3_9PROT|nr:sterol desaturase family protein [Parvularcula maris]